MSVVSQAQPSPGLGRRLKSALNQLMVYLLLAAGGFIMVVPFLFLISSSLKTDTEILAFPPTLFPSVWDFANYPETWVKGNFGQYTLNSMFISVSRTVLVLTTSALAAYAFARIEFPGRNILFILLLSTMMLPSQVTLIPVYVLVKRLPLVGGNDLFGNGGSGLINTYTGIIVPGYVNASGIFLLRQFMRTLPWELDDAARIDGCTEFGIFSRIILPLTKPALAALSLFTFQGAWNDFLWPLLVGQRKYLWTLQVALSRFRVDVESGVVEWPYLLAGTVIATVPILIVFIFTQKYFIRGIVLSGIKG
jgi:multiple sugar transport system permease protein